MQVRNPYAPPSETLKTDDYSILDNLKVETAIQRQRDRLLRTRTTQPCPSVSRTNKLGEEAYNDDDDNADDNVVVSNNNDNCNSSCRGHTDDLINEVL